MQHDPKDLRDKFWLMVTDWMEDKVPNERTIYRVDYLRKRLNGTVYRHEHDAMNFVIESINKEARKLHERAVSPEPEGKE